MIHQDLCKQSVIVFKAIQIRDFIYFQLLFCVASCTICVDTAVYRNLASRLTLEECRELVASLYYPSYEFPATIDEYLVISTSAKPRSELTDCGQPKNNFCLQLLVEWDKKAGKNCTHIHIECRLRQMNKIELADWLGKTVFHQLANDINDTLLQNPFTDSNEELALTSNFKLLEDRALVQVNDKLTRFDFVLRSLVIILLVILMVVCCRILWLTYGRNGDGRIEEEMRNLIDRKNVNEN